MDTYTDPFPLGYRPGHRGLTLDQIRLKRAVIRDAEAMLAAEPGLTRDAALQRAVLTATRPPMANGIVRARDVAEVLPPSPMALRREDEGWHRVSRAVRDGFVLTCGEVIPLAECGAVDAWAEIADAGTVYCIECLALDQGEWTQGRFPNGDAVPYVIATRAQAWSSAAHSLRVALGIRHPR
jgi:hypothetical protein